jgi:hypothetical protein
LIENLLNCQSIGHHVYVGVNPPLFHSHILLGFF